MTAHNLFAPSHSAVLPFGFILKLIPDANLAVHHCILSLRDKTIITFCQLNLKIAMCYKIDGRLYINSSTQPGNGILMSGSQVTHLAEVNEELICRYLETKWDTRLHGLRQVLKILKTSKYDEALTCGYEG